MPQEQGGLDEGWQLICLKLAANNEVLKVARGDNERAVLGQFYILNTRINGVVHKNVNLERLGREVGALQKWEFHDDKEDKSLP